MQVSRTEQWELHPARLHRPRRIPDAGGRVLHLHRHGAPCAGQLGIVHQHDPYTGYSHTLDTRSKTLDQEDSFAGFENYEFFALDDVVSDFADLPGTEAPTRAATWKKMGARFITETSFTVPNGAAGYPTDPYHDYDPYQQENVPEDAAFIFGPGDAEVSITGVTRSDPDADGSVTYTVAFDTTATLRYGFTKALLDDGTITELGMGRCFAGFGLLDAQTGTVFARSRARATGRGAFRTWGTTATRSSCAHRPRPTKIQRRPQSTREDPASRCAR